MCCLEAVEEFSGVKVYKNKPEPRNNNVNPVYFYSSAEIGNVEISRMEFAHD